MNLIKWIYLVHPDEGVRQRTADRLRQTGCKVEATDSFSVRRFWRSRRRQQLLVVPARPPIRAIPLLHSAQKARIPTATIELGRPKKRKNDRRKAPGRTR